MPEMYYEEIIEALYRKIASLEKGMIENCHGWALSMEEIRNLHHDLNNALQAALINQELLARVQHRIIQHDKDTMTVISDASDITKGY